MKLIRAGHAAVILIALCVPLFLWLLPADHFDQGPSLCLSILIFDTPCYACGMTRAIQHLMHLDFEKAWEFNKLSFAVLPLLIYLWAGTILDHYRKFRNAGINPKG